MELREADQTTAPRIGILTSGGDSPGMNAAIRAVVRTTLRLGGRPYAIHEGWAGAVAGGEAVRELSWDDVGGVLSLGGTVLGTARCPEFRTRDGLRAAAEHLIEHEIDRLVVIGGDGSLRGTEEFRQEWPSLLDELVEQGRISEEMRAAHPRLAVAGLVGSIDNDMAGTDTTIGADTALRRICDALDALRSTAASHRRAFVVEVMGRHCGYLALMAGVAGGADAVFVPEAPPARDWEQQLITRLESSRAAGLRDLIVVVAEGAVDLDGNAISSAHVGEVISEGLGGEGARVTILGHVQRGGRPSAYDRWMPTLLGYASVHEVLHAEDAPARVMGVKHNRIAALSLEDSVAATNEVKAAMAAGDFEVARATRGRSFDALSRVVHELCAVPGSAGLVTGADEGSAAERTVAVAHVGGLAPGMNAAVRALVRTSAFHGGRCLGVRGSVQGLVNGDYTELGWAEVDDWVASGGCELGTARRVPTEADLPAIAEGLARSGTEALVLVGGLDAYRTAEVLERGRGTHAGLDVPIVCVPAAIDNNLPGAELSIGADTALNVIVEALDQVRTSASAMRRCFVVETMGGASGYLPMMAGLAAGAERVYLPEEELRVADLADDAERMTRTFEAGRRLWLALRGEQAGSLYDTNVMARIFEDEGGDLFDVRQIVLGHVQDGAVPTPFDRLLATRLTRGAWVEIERQLTEGTPATCYLGEVDGTRQVRPISALAEDLVDGADRPRDQWWATLRPIGSILSDRRADVEVRELPTLEEA